MNTVTRSSTLDAHGQKQPPDAGASSGVYAKVVAVASTALVAVPLGVLAAMSGKYAEIYRDFGVRLSPLTRSLLAIGQAIGTLPGVAVLFVAAVAWSATVFALVSRSKGTGVVFLVCAILFCVVSVLSFVLGLFIPLASMTDGLQGQATP